MQTRVQQVDWQHAKKHLIQLREKAFVLEWRIPRHIEFDCNDKDAFHILVFNEQQQAVGTARLTREGELGRIAVNQTYRCNAVYQQMIEALLEVAHQQNLTTITVQCELNGIERLSSLGFSPVGQVYMDAGVPRQRMQIETDNCHLKQIGLTH